ncbi:hypothetical protein Csa_006411, partial [Cucumis sativus]
HPSDCPALLLVGEPPQTDSLRHRPIGSRGIFAKTPTMVEENFSQKASQNPKNQLATSTAAATQTETAFFQLINAK